MGLRWGSERNVADLRATTVQRAFIATTLYVSTTLLWHTAENKYFGGSVCVCVCGEKFPRGLQGREVLERR